MSIDDELELANQRTRAELLGLTVYEGHTNLGYWAFVRRGHEKAHASITRCATRAEAVALAVQRAIDAGIVTEVRS